MNSGDNGTSDHCSNRGANSADVEIEPNLPADDASSFGSSSYDASSLYSTSRPGSRGAGLDDYVEDNYCSTGQLNDGFDTDDDDTFADFTDNLFLAKESRPPSALSISSVQGAPLCANVPFDLRHPDFGKFGFYALADYNMVEKVVEDDENVVQDK